MSTYLLFVGADNDTRMLNWQLINQIMTTRHHGGYTVFQGEGYWQGQKEPTAIICVSDSDTNVRGTAIRLRDQLEQEAVAMVRLPGMEMI